MGKMNTVDMYKQWKFGLWFRWDEESQGELMWLNPFPCQRIPCTEKASTSGRRLSYKLQPFYLTSSFLCWRICFSQHASHKPLWSTTAQLRHNPSTFVRSTVYVRNEDFGLGSCIWSCRTLLASTLWQDTFESQIGKRDLSTLVRRCRVKGTSVKGRLTYRCLLLLLLIIPDWFKCCLLILKKTFQYLPCTFPPPHTVSWFSFPSKQKTTDLPRINNIRM